MNPYYNLPQQQRVTQWLVDEFNAAERHWESLEGKRQLRSSMRPELSEEDLKALDLLDFERTRPVQEHPPRTLSL